jgi:sugar-specific transcriptional regulator TrmB
MYEQTLVQSGLDREQAIIYEVLLKHGQLSAGAVHKLTPLKRGLVYKVLDELTALGLIEKQQEAGKVIQFAVTHPLTLKELAEKREQEAKDAKMALEGVLPSLVSDFNLVSGQPGVQFFEGPEGVWEVLRDSLHAKKEVYTYADIEAVDKHIREINERYVKARNKLGLDKKLLLLDTPYARERMRSFYKLTTDTRFIKIQAEPFQSLMEIYDESISYVTFAEERMIGVIIHDPAIASMHRSLFEYMWASAEKLTPQPIAPVDAS